MEGRDKTMTTQSQPKRNPAATDRLAGSGFNAFGNLTTIMFDSSGSYAPMYREGRGPRIIDWNGNLFWRACRFILSAVARRSDPTANGMRQGENPNGLTPLRR